jgi:hypothetical protein
MDGALVNTASLADILAAVQASAKAAVPPLREELRLLPAAANHDGSPAWMVHDPINNRFFRIGWLDFEILLRWSQGSPQAIAQSVSEETTLSIDETDVGALLHFLEQHNLLQANSASAVNRLRQRSAQMKKNPYEWLLHNYLFFRVPLIRPQVWLAAIMPDRYCVDGHRHFPGHPAVGNFCQHRGRAFVVSRLFGLCRGACIRQNAA